MDNSTGTSVFAGRIGMLLCGIGVISFFVGIFGGPRVMAFVGISLMAASLVGFYVEENIQRKISRARIN